MPTPRFPLPEPGTKYGWWEYLEEAPQRRSDRYLLCRCSGCGDVHEVRFASLRYGATKSCIGCAAQRTGVARVRHFMTDGRPAMRVAAEHGIKEGTFLARVNVLGWEVDKAATTPANQARKVLAS